MRSHPVAAVLALLLSTAVVLPAAAQWKWRDASGHTQYSDTPPPPGVPEKDILQRPAAPRRAVVSTPAASAAASAPVAASAPRVDPQLEAKRRKAEDEKAAQKRADDEKRAAARAENCARARGHLKMLEDGMRIVRSNEKGEREYLDDQQRAEEVRRTREIIAADCN